MGGSARARRGQQPARSSERKESEQDAHGSPDERISILLLDDSAPLRALLAELLADFSFVRRIEKAGDGASALRAPDAGPFDFAILDLNIPGDDRIGNGIELTRAIKSLHPNTKIALITAHGSSVDRNACIDAGADRFYDKGEFEDLLEWISESVERE